MNAVTMLWNGTHLLKLLCWPPSFFSSSSCSHISIRRMYSLRLFANFCCVAFTTFPKEFPQRAAAIAAHVSSKCQVDVPEEELSDVVIKLEQLFPQHNGTHSHAPRMPLCVWSPLAECTEEQCSLVEPRPKLILKSVASRQLLSNCVDAPDEVQYGTLPLNRPQLSIQCSRASIRRHQTVSLLQDRVSFELQNSE